MYKKISVLVGLSLLVSPYIATARTEAIPVSNCPQILRTLTRGSRGNDVSSLQVYLEISPTGYFGSLTATAVAKFQARKGLAQVGIVGPQTRAALARNCSDP